MNLRAEMLAYYGDLQHKHAMRLMAMGVTTMPRINALGILGFTRGTITGDLWSPAEDGASLVTIGVREENEIVDIVAFDPADPDVWGLRRGDGWILGHAALEEVKGAWEGQNRTLKLHATPLDWLRADCDGACVIDGYTSMAAAEIRDLPSIEVSSNTFARALRLQLTKPPQLPEIHIQRGQRHAA